MEGFIKENSTPSRCFSGNPTGFWEYAAAHHVHSQIE